MAKITKQYFTSSGTFTVPSGVTELLCIGAGGGGGGGGSTISTLAGGGGGGAAILTSQYITVVPNTGYTVTIGAVGTGGTAGNNGTDGGTTSFGTLFYANGGGKGFVGGATAGGGGGNISGLTSAPIAPVAGGGGAGGAASTAGTVGNYNWLSQGGNYSGGTGGANGGGSTNSFAFVQKQYSSFISGSALSGTTAGNTLIFMSQTSNTTGGAVTGLSDNLGNTWAGVSTLESTYYLNIFWCLSGKGGNITRLTNTGNVSPCFCYLAEYSGPANAWDQNIISSAGSGSVTFTPAVAGELGVTAIWDTSGSAVTFPTGYNSRSLDVSDTYSLADKLSLSTGSQSPTWTGIGAGNRAAWLLLQASTASGTQGGGGGGGAGPQSGGGTGGQGGAAGGSASANTGAGGGGGGAGGTTGGAGGAGGSGYLYLIWVD